MIKPIHPFPARMAPELAIAALQELRFRSIVLDPMMGSGTVVRQAADLGHDAIGYDSDPLAVLMAGVWTTPLNDAAAEELTRYVIAEAKELPDELELPWIDHDDETRCFVDYWFARQQQNDLRRIAYVLSRLQASPNDADNTACANMLRVALSRIIITKDQGASLGRDISHSRPHRVATDSSFEVFPAFERSVRRVRRHLVTTPPRPTATVRLGDARTMTNVDRGSVDAILTSPPYLNAIDYMRGHRLSLVWLGHQLKNLRSVRGSNIGAERGPGERHVEPTSADVVRAMVDTSQLSSRHARMVVRYAQDLGQLMREVARVLKPAGTAVLVVGNSCLKDSFIRNSDGIVAAASCAGLRLAHQVTRELPAGNRYLPMPSGSDGPLAKRMRTENILTFSAT